MGIRKLLLVLTLPICTGASFPQKKSPLGPDHVKSAVFSLTKVMMHDVVSPTIASRYYLYGTLGASSILAFGGGPVHPSAYVPHFPKTVGSSGPSADASLSSLFCIYETGMMMLPSGADIAPEYERVRGECMRSGYSKKQVEDARAKASAVSKEVLAYASKDGYSKLSSFTRYRSKRRDGFWFPTPPAYMDAVDPHWSKMRTMVMDSARHFRPGSPVPFDTTKGSAFMSLVREVAETGTNLTTEQREIAGFWDCNPFVVATSGHMMLGFKKISPGGHWMNIACIAAKQRKISLEQTIQVVSLTALTLYDAFISCWAAKYDTDRVRPETAINKYLDVRWQPLLQTPPFPEYTSGHSVISAATAETLSFLMGDTLNYVDDTEVIFELAPRRFTSFRQAAAEAGISRLYGGIHFRDAIEQGQRQGVMVGRHIVGVVSLAGVKPF